MKYSEAELKLIKAFDLDHLLTSRHPCVIYTKMMERAFLENRQDDAAQSLRRCMRAVIKEGKPFRSTPEEWDALLKPSSANRDSNASCESSASKESRASVEEAYPEKPPLRRTIFHLWSEFGMSFFRVNYYDEKRERFPETYFLVVEDGVVERLDEPVPGDPIMA